MQHPFNLNRGSYSNSLLLKSLSIGIASFYILFTLLPNSNSLMVKWPLVFFWQFGLMLGPITLLFQIWKGSFRRLGSLFDGIAIAWSITLILSATFAEFAHQAFWYAWAALCSFSFLYVLNAWLTSHSHVRKLLVFQGCLSTAFNVYSISAWLLLTVKPQLAILEQLKEYGIERSFDLTEIMLPNWHPVGHRNYVAGYVVLTLPLLLGLALSTIGRARLLWLGSFLLSLITLYSTGSRGGLLGATISAFVFITIAILYYPNRRKQLLGASVISFVTIVLWGVSNERIRSSIISIFTVDPTVGPSYRSITNATGWFMGLDHPILGAGPGSVTLLYQKYRPMWATGSESELTYQLHSTPTQVWAELGIFGIALGLVTVLAIAVLSLHRIRSSHTSLEFETKSAAPQLLLIGIFSALSGYTAYSCTDYQLDNVCISGVITIFVVVLTFERRMLVNLSEQEISRRELRKTTMSSRSRFATFLGTGLLLAISIWLYPIHRAWMLSSYGFLSLQKNDVPAFVSYLEKSHRLASWEPYYPYQLGWNLGELAFQSEDDQQREILRQESIKWFQKAISLSPNREFGYSNLGWLQVNAIPNVATQNFQKAAQLTPDKQGVFFALGYSLMKEDKLAQALQAMVTELHHHPILLTSQIWNLPELMEIYPQVLSEFEKRLYQELSQTYIKVEKSYLYQTLFSMYWWKGDFNRARKIFEKIPTPLNEALLLLSQSQMGDRIEPIVIEKITGKKKVALKNLITAWQKPENRDSMLKEIVASPQSKLTSPVSSHEIFQSAAQMRDSMEESLNFHDWVVNKLPSRLVRNQRLGFGVTSRHIDGPIPVDFSSRSRKAAISILFPSR